MPSACSAPRRDTNGEIRLIAIKRLKILREHALIESAVSSNRIEGVTVEHDRVRPVVIGKARLRDRDR